MLINSNKELVQHIKNKASMYLDNMERDSNVLNAMLEVDRINFLPENLKKFAYEDRPLPIGFDQTTSQPSMIAFILDKLEIKPDNIILEIGAGCGYASALAMKLCGKKGLVYACEIMKGLSETLKKNLAEYTENIKILIHDGSAGFQQYAPFDRIFISAGIKSSNFKKEILLDQLKDDGILVYPESHGNIYVIKKNKNKIKTETYYGVSFVPLNGINS